MIAAGLTGPNGAEVSDLEELARLADQGANCYWHDIPISALAMLDAATSSTEWNYSVAEKRAPRFRDAVIHEASVGGIVQEVGAFAVPLSVSTPTAIEVVFCKLILQGMQYQVIMDKDVWFQSAHVSGLLTPVIQEALKCGRETFFHRNSISSAEVGADPGSARIFRHIQFSYENYAKKYGFLELFRALEMNFLDNLLKYISNNFLRNSEATLKTGLERLKAENKLAYNVIKETGCQALAEEIADTINRARSLGNTFAGALYDAYEKRTDKSNDKIWRGACYLFSVRCAIAHAGQSNIVYEDYSDSDVLLAQIYPFFEDILLNVAGVRSTAP